MKLLHKMWRSVSFSIAKYKTFQIVENQEITSLITYSVSYSLSNLKIYLKLKLPQSLSKKTYMKVC